MKLFCLMIIQRKPLKILKFIPGHYTPESLARGLSCQQRHTHQICVLRTKLVKFEARINNYKEKVFKAFGIRTKFCIFYFSLFSYRILLTVDIIITRVSILHACLSDLITRFTINFFIC